MRNKRDNTAYVQDIRDSIDKITSYTSSHTFDAFAASEWDQAAVIRYFEIIGEAANNIDDYYKALHSQIEWRNMSDFRNFLIHDYADIDIGIVWDAMTQDIPLLKAGVENVLKR